MNDRTQRSVRSPAYRRRLERRAKIRSVYSRLASGAASCYEIYAARSLDLITTPIEQEPLSDSEREFIVYDEDGEPCLSLEYFSMSVENGLQKHSNELQFLYDTPAEESGNVEPSNENTLDVDPSGQYIVLDEAECRESDDLEGDTSCDDRGGRFNFEQQERKCSQIDFESGINYLRIHSFQSLIEVRSERSSNEVFQGRTSTFRRGKSVYSSIRSLEPIRRDETFYLMPGTILIYAPPNSGKSHFNQMYGNRFYDTDFSVYGHGIILTNCHYFAWLWGNSGQRVIYLLPSKKCFYERTNHLPDFRESWYDDAARHSIGLTLLSDKYVSEVIQFNDNEIKIVGQWLSIRPP
jgi:hypothetical protein